ncbi:hypothetical protein [Sulfuriferula nivalis]|nr:hypothetical protein [Sulfuriferula nivalis]
MKKPPRYSAKDVHNIRIGSLLTFLIYVFIILIPLSYTWMVTIPPINQLQVTSGELTYKKVGKNGSEYLTGIRNSAGVTYFTCASGIFGEHPDCLFPVTEYPKLAGRPAVAWWYEQPVYFFVMHKHLVRVVVTGEEKISYEKTLAWSRSTSKSAPWFILIMLGVFILIIVWFEVRIKESVTEH